MKNNRGFTFIELIITIVISAIAMMALSAPFVAERRSWLLGTAQSESQRDAQLGLRAIARKARQGGFGSPTYTISQGGAQFGFNTPGGGACFQGGLAFGNQLRMFSTSNCGGASTILIDGNRSQVTNFTITAINSRLVQVRLDVTYNNSENESLITEILLRNAT